MHSGAIRNGVLEFWIAENILKARKLYGVYWRYSKNVVDDFLLSYWMWNMFITEITINKTIRYNVKFLASRWFYITSNIRLLNTPVYLQTLKDMIYSLNCLSVLLCTQSVYFVWAVVIGVTSLADFHI